MSGPEGETYGEKPIGRRSAWRSVGLNAYLFALAAVAATLVARIVLSSFIDGRPLLVLFVLAVLAASAWGGLGPALLATVLSLFGALLLTANTTGLAAV